MNKKLRIPGLAWRAMKMSVHQFLIILLFCGFAYAREAAGQEILSRPVSLKLENVKLKKVLLSIESQTNVRFVYSSSVIDINQKVNVNATNKNLDAILRDLLKPIAVSYTVSENRILLKTEKKEEKALPQKPTGTIESVNAAARLLTGTVADETGAGLPGVSVLLKGTQKGTTTDVNGKYQISAQTDSDVLVFSFVGYLTQEVAVGSQTTLDITLKPDTKALEEVVVVGYGTQKKVNLTGALSMLDMKTKENTPVTNASQALHGVSGLWVNQAGSRPGADNATIRIRGVGTTNNSNPLVLVNGMEYDMNEVNPNDIETITVLKDASAAIYGSRAANGVVLITTKTGVAGKSKISYNFSHGIQSPTMMPDVIWDPIQYMQLKNQALRNEGKTVVDYSDAQIEQYRNGMASNPYAYPNINWFDQVMKNGSLNQHHLQFSGGTDKTLYKLSLGYMDQKGVLIANDNAKRYSIDLNLSTQVTNRLRVGANIIANYRKSTEPADGTGGYFTSLMRVLPIFTPYVEDGRYGNVVFRTPGRNLIENPMKLVKEGYRKPTVQRIFAKLFADYQLPYDIKYSVNLGIDKLDNVERRFNSRVNTYDPLTLAVMNYGQTVSYNGNVSNLNLNFFQTLSWNKTFAGGHNLSALVGTSYNDFDNSLFNASIENLSGNMLTDLKASALNPVIGGEVTRDKLTSFFGRANYDFKEKYLLEAVLRYDGSSRFGQNNRWGVFPGLSAGWRIDQESFFDVNFINLLKLRASIGKLGNQAVPLYSYLNVVNLGADYSFGNLLQPGAAATSYNDPNISWETTTTYNAGIDAEFWSGKLSAEFEVFKKRTSGILRQVALPSQIGALAGPQSNIGVVDNKGFELTMSHRNRIGAFRYEIRPSVSYVKNKIVDLNGETVINGRRILKEGYALDAYYLLQAEGIYQTQEEVNNSAKVSSAVKPGYIKYKDVDGNGTINGDDRVITGSSIPKWNYSFAINLTYKQFSLNTYFQGVQGINIYPTANLAYPVNNGAGLTKEWATDSWTPENRGAKLPILTTPQGASENYQGSTAWLRSGSYLRAQNIQLNYAFPEKWVSRASISKLNLFANVQNFFTFSKYKDSDPERNITADNLYDYPMLKTVSFGLNVTF
ncbi:TonB-dependent receptor [Dyadobacter sp. Leaf189]|uniref:TonB-dependent receptor n=1 Tax=Dyadobacter sp. Leaf189 TaxID=1736295 RepID=UPI0006FD1A7B|nr:TonB-dependent receptor [Dyadobacter sp. Leaf189]KQS30879.1 SusC/RagA family TonB-linked outer membrane protein [Dyadobacter sp. Leaf189]